MASIDPIEFQRIRYKFLNLSSSFSDVLVANNNSVLSISNSFSISLSESAAVLQAGLTSLGSSLLILSQSTSSSLSASAAAITNGIAAVGLTIMDVSTSLSTSAETARELLRSSLTDLVNQNSGSFALVVSQIDAATTGALNDIQIINGDINDIDNNITDIERKTGPFAQDSNDESQYRTLSLGATATSVFSNFKNFNYIPFVVRGTSFPTPLNYWAYTVSYPTGVNPFKINSYSYMGTTNGTSSWNLEEVIAYTKREYQIDESSLGGYDANNTMQNGGAPIATSSLTFKADQVNILKGRTNLTSPTLLIVGDTSDTNGVGLNQGQLAISDEDLAGHYLQIGIENGTGRIQNSNGLNGYPIYFNPTQGLCVFGPDGIQVNGDAEIHNTLIRSDNISINDYGVGNRSAYVDFVGDDTYQEYGLRVLRGNTGLNTNSEINHRGAGQLNINCVDNGNIVFYTNNIGRHVVDSGGPFRPLNTEQVDLGKSDKRWLNVYTKNPVNVSSDLRLKTDISSSILGLDFLNKLNPVSYRMLNGDVISVSSSTSGYDDNNQPIVTELITRRPAIRRHYGLIAQEVEKALSNFNITTKDFAAVVYDPQTDDYSLRYTEFISPMIKAIQELSTENDYLKEKLQEKENQINDILARLTALENK